LGVDLSVAMFDMQKEDSGVSPVIGVILMVAVTVALVALVTVVVFDLGGDVSDSPDATVQLEQSSNGMNATLLRNENVEEIYLSDGTNDFSSTNGETGYTSGDGISDAGAIINAAAPNIEGDTGTMNVIAVMPDGSEEVLTSADYDFTG
jgi:flagellin-like protein